VAGIVDGTSADGAAEVAVAAADFPVAPKDVSGHFFTASDGARIHYLTWAAKPGPTRAVLVFLHGIASHAAWFEETAEHLVAAGISVYAPDRRGSGRSGGERGHLARYEQALSDLRRMLQIAAGEQPGVPLFLAGSSWAAKLAVVYAARRPDDLAGLVLLAPGLVPRVNLPLRQRLAVLAGHLVAPHRRLPIPLTPEMYTGSAEHLAYIRNDALRLLTATTRFYWETNRLDRLRNRVAPRVRIPVLVQQGEKDAMMDVAGTRRWLARVGTPDRTMIVYKGAEHTLDFEDHAEAYRRDLADWVLARAGAAG
jgi:alpha-beta hydrolase superfamily lysophospholipase